MSSSILETNNSEKLEVKETQNLRELKKRQEEFLERVESKLKRSEKDIWFINNEDHPHKESISKSTHR